MAAANKLRIAVDARSLLCAQPRGEGKSLLRLYTQLVHDRRDIEPIFFGDAATSRYKGDVPNGVRLVSTAFWGDRLNAWEDLFFPFAARAARCQVMHCTSSGGPRHALMPMVMTVHDLIPILFDDGQSATARQLFLDRLRRGMEQACRVMTVSAHTRNDLLRLFPQAKSKTEVVHWGADPLSVLAPVDGPATVLAFGGEARRKNTDYMLDRFIAAAKRVPRLRLRLIGVSSARQRQSILQRMTTAGLHAQLDMPGFVDEAELEALLRSSTVLLYLSLYEGFGVPVLEAVARGLAVLASDRTSIRELLEGAPGCLDLDRPQEIEDAIVDLVLNASHRQRHAIAQAAILFRFDWAATSRKVAKTLELAVSH